MRTTAGPPPDARQIFANRVTVGPGHPPPRCHHVFSWVVHVIIVGQRELIPKALSRFQPARPADLPFHHGMSVLVSLPGCAGAFGGSLLRRKISEIFYEEKL